VTCALRVSDAADALADDVQLNLYHIAQESLTNVARHARASRVSLSLRVSGDAISLIIRDNGSGFDPGAATDGIGLPGMRERVLALGGRMWINSRLGEGTRLVFHLPRVQLTKKNTD